MHSAHPIRMDRARLHRLGRSICLLVLLSLATGCSALPLRVETSPHSPPDARETRSRRADPLSCELSSPQWLSACGSGRSQVDAEDDALRVLSLRLQTQVQSQLTQVKAEDRQGMESAFQELTSRELHITSDFEQEGGLSFRVQPVPGGFEAEARLDRVAALSKLYARAYQPQAENFRRLADDALAQKDDVLRFTPLWREARALGEALQQSARPLELLVTPEAVGATQNPTPVGSAPSELTSQDRQALDAQRRLLLELSADRERLRVLEAQARSLGGQPVLVWGRYGVDQQVAAALNRQGIQAAAGEGQGVGIRLETSEDVQQSGEMWACTLALIPMRVRSEQKPVPLLESRTAQGRSRTAQEQACRGAMERIVQDPAWLDALTASFCTGFPCKQDGLLE